MTDRSIVPASEPDGQGGWLSDYMPANQVVAHQPQSRFLDIATVRGILFRQRWLIAAVLVAAAIAGVVATLLATPMYEARATVRIEPYGFSIVEGQDVERSIASNQVRDLLATQIGIITSRRLAGVVAQDLNLADRPGYLGEDIEDSRPPNLTDEQWQQRKLEMATNKVLGGVSAELPLANWIIEIAYRSPDPRLAAEIANAYSAAFAALESQDTLENNVYAQDYLRDQIELTRGRLQEAEQAANAYARANGIILQSMGEDGEGNATLTSVNLGTINAQRAAAQAARIEAEQRWRSVQNLPPVQLSEVQGNALLQGLIAERTNKRTELAEQRQRFLDGHPTIIALRAQLDTLDAQIESISSDIKAAIQNEYVVARNQEQALLAELSQATGATLEEQDRQVEYGVLEREADALRDQLAALLQRFNQISTASNVQTGTINQLDAAVVPGAPYAPSLMRNLFLALMGGAVVAAGLVLLREMFDEKIRSFDDVERSVGLPLLGYTPYVQHRSDDLDDVNNFDPLMEAYATIGSTIDFALPNDRSVIQVTSTQASEGKSTSAMTLAAQFANLGRSVLLVDGDLRRPSLSELLGVSRPKAGLVDVLLGKADMESALIHREGGLDILPIRKSPTNPVEMLASRQLREFVAHCRERYSLVIFDSAPVLGLADALTLARIVDGTVFVMEANRTNVGQARNAIRRLQTNGGNPIGVILTKYKSLEAGDDYSYQYAYYSYADKQAEA